MGKLTIIVPVKKRDEFTARFLRYHERLGYDIRVAEGDDPNTFTYFRKVLHALAVSTPYIMMADHDDLLIGMELERHVEFLENNPDYVACGGRVAGFAIVGNRPYGGLRRFNECYSPFDMPRDFCNPAAEARILSGFTNSWSYYSVMRQEAAFTIWKEIVESGIGNLQVHEKFCAARLLSLGKVKGFPYISYLKQYNTTVRDLSIEWIETAIRTDLTGDMERAIRLITPHQATRNELRTRWIEWFIAFIWRTHGWRGWLGRWAKHNHPWIIRAWRNRPGWRHMFHAHIQMWLLGRPDPTLKREKGMVP